MDFLMNVLWNIFYVIYWINKVIFYGGGVLSVLLANSILIIILMYYWLCKRWDSLCLKKFNSNKTYRKILDYCKEEYGKEFKIQFWETESKEIDDINDIKNRWFSSFDDIFIPVNKNGEIYFNGTETGTCLLLREVSYILAQEEINCPLWLNSKVSLFRLCLYETLVAELIAFEIAKNINLQIDLEILNQYFQPQILSCLNEIASGHCPKKINIISLAKQVSSTLKIKSDWTSSIIG